MLKLLPKAIGILKTEDYTCVLCKGADIYTSRQRGIAPLLDWLEGPIDLRGCVAADKVVGKAAALLYAHMGAIAIYAETMSEAAISVLEQHSIVYHCVQRTAAIMNRDKSALCPMEQAVLHIEDSEATITAIKSKLAELQAK